ncbi:hypothetical protein BJ741DRAFT_593455 [Chytriomyces cf. hyalinus JEL632]|nr:hypothetical protein BJ741DRAFT_593455 [Chytriomyces cf. hyalinus JEL632]
MASPLCNYAIVAANQESRACGQAPSEALLNSCVCTTFDAESIAAFCANDALSEWESTYNGFVAQREKSCKIANMTVVPHTLLPIPSEFQTQLTASSGAVTSATGKATTRGSQNTVTSASPAASESSITALTQAGRPGSADYAQNTGLSKSGESAVFSISVSALLATVLFFV